jgi:hypothetical protein
LQAVLEGAQQKGDEDREGQDPLPGEGLLVCAMGRDKVGRAEDLGEVVDQVGMEGAKPVSWFLL